MIQIIPAIDLIDGKCVRLEKGNYSTSKIYSEDPFEMAMTFESWGIKRLHLVDLDGAKAKRIVNSRVLNRIATKTNLIIDFGGGLRSESDIRIAFENGASMVTGGSIAIQDPVQFLKWLSIYGSDKIILGADHNNEMISTNAWTEDSNTGLFPFLKDFIIKGITQVICTDIEKDGMLMGPSLGLYKGILEKWPDLYLIASGGVSGLMDVIDLEKAGVPAVIIGKAIYENRISKEEIENFIVNSEF
jgi:phosphoribosylformimino-5-aminoimidazole carboxamide ribotide isomerase